MANWQVISLDTTTPQLRAPGTGDGYSFNSGSTQLGVWTTTGLGIGTASPSSKLHLSGAATADARLTFTQTTAGLSSQIQQGSSGMAISALGSQAMLLETNGTERLRIDSSGNVGIGTASPASKLHVSGSTNGGTIEIISANTYYLAGSTDETVSFQGEFYQDDVAANRAAGYVRFGKSGDFSNNANASSFVSFATRNAGTLSEKARIDASGNLGVGVTPSASQTWVAGSNTQKVVAVTDGATNSLLQLKGYRAAVSGNGILVLAKSRGATIGTETATSSGDSLGIVSFEGVNSSNTVAGSSYILGAQDGAAGATYVPGRLQFYTSDGTNAPTERVRIDASGNVGIGTISPTKMLELSANNGAGVLNVLRFTDTDAAVTAAQPTGRIEFAENDGGDTTVSAFFEVETVSTAGGGEMKFGTGAAGVAATERMRIDSSGNVGIGTTSPGAKLHVAAGNILIDNNRAFSAFDNAGTQETLLSISTANNVSVSAPTLSGSLDFNIRNSTGSHRFFSGGSERARIDSSGRLLVGGTSAVYASSNGAIEVQSANAASLSAGRFAANTGGPTLTLLKSRNATVGGNTIVVDGDTLGDVSFVGANGTGYDEAARIRASVDGTPGASADMPGRLTFWTSADGSATPTERMRITNNGQVYIAPTTSTYPTVTTVAGTPGVINLANALIINSAFDIVSPYTQSIQIDIVFPNWGSNNVIGLVDLTVVTRQYGATGGTAFGKIFATNTASATTFSTFNTTNVTTSQCTLTAASGGNYTLRITIDPTNNTDRCGIYLVIPNGGVSNVPLSSVTISLV